MIPPDRFASSTTGVARAWRWHPDAMAAALRTAGLSERWRLVTPPDDMPRIAECHLVCGLAA